MPRLADRFRRISGAAGALAVGLTLALAVSQSRAQTVTCTDSWELVGNGYTVTISGDYCAGEEARLSAQGYHASACTSTGVQATYTLTDPAGATVETRTWIRLPAGCAVAAPVDPAPTGGTVQAEVVEARNRVSVLLMAGLAVIAFGLGYMGGFQR